MFGRLIGETLASPVRVVEIAAGACGQVTECVAGTDAGFKDLSDEAGELADQVSDGVKDVLESGY